MCLKTLLPGMEGISNCSVLYSIPYCVNALPTKADGCIYSRVQPLTGYISSVTEVQGTESGATLKGRGHKYAICEDT